MCLEHAAALWGRLVGFRPISGVVWGRRCWSVLFWYHRIKVWDNAFAGAASYSHQGVVHTRIEAAATWACCIGVLSEANGTGHTASLWGVGKGRRCQRTRWLRSCKACGARAWRPGSPW